MPQTEELIVDGGTVVAHRYRPVTGHGDAAGDLEARSRSSAGRARRRCLLVPPFRVAANVLEPVAEALAADGFEVVSIDPRNHVGLGSGDIAGFRLSGLVDDCRAAIRAYEPTCTVAVSLGARAALRALSLERNCRAAVFLTPVVDVHATLRAVLERDWFAVPHRQVPARVPVLGIDIDAPRFLRDCERAELVTLTSAQRDLARYDGRLTMVPGTADPWVDLTSIRGLVASLDDDAARVTVRPVDCDRHTFHEDPDLALRLIGTMLEEVRAIHDRETMAS